MKKKIGLGSHSFISILEEKRSPSGDPFRIAFCGLDNQPLCADSHMFAEESVVPRITKDFQTFVIRSGFEPVRFSAQAEDWPFADNPGSPAPRPSTRNNVFIL